MSDQIEVKARLTATNEASPVIRQLKQDVDALAASLKKAFSVSVGTELTKSLQRVADQHGEVAGQMRRQVAEMKSARDARRRLNAEIFRGSQISQTAARVHARQQAAALDYDKSRLSFALRMSRQRDREAAQAEREHQASMRRYGRERAAAGRSALSRGRDAIGRGGNGFGRSTRSAGTVGALGFGAAALAARKTLMSEVAVDSAEIGTRIYGKLGKDAAAALRKDWAGPLSQQLGVTTADLLRSYTEALKVGVPDVGAKEFSSLATQVSEAWELPFDQVVDTLGTVNTLLTSGGKAFDISRIRSVANGIQHLAASMATTPEKMISFMRRGAGAAQLLGMSQEAGLAFGAASTSLGNEAFSSGRAFDFMAGRLAELPRIMRRNGSEAQEARKLIGLLGYGSLANLQQKQKASPDEFVFDFLDRFNRIQDPQKRNEALRFFAGQEWLGELGRMVTGMGTVREAQRLAKEAKRLDAISSVWELHKTKLLFAFKQVRVGFLNVLGEAGMLLSPVVAQVRDYFLGWVDVLRNGGLKDRLAAAGRGFLDGLGFKSVPDMLNGIFGKPGEGDAGSIKAWGDAAKGFAAGLADVGRSIRALFSALPGAGDAEGIGRWTARILSFSMAARIASPAFDLVAGFGNILLSFASAAMSFMALRKVLSLGALAGGGAAAAAGGGLALTLAGVALVGGAIAVAIMNWEGIWNWLKGGPASKLLRGDLSGRSEEYDRDQAEVRKRLDGARSRGWGWLKQLFGIGEAKAGELPATFRRSATDLRESIDSLGAKIQFASLSGSAASVAGRFTAPAAAAGRAFEIGGSPDMIGNGRVNAHGLGRRGILGGRFTSGTPGAGLYDAIINAEGTARGGRDPYNTLLGYGRWGSPSKPLTDMTLNEVREFGLQMRRAQLANGTAWKDTSSASGAFQIVGNTMMDAARALGMDPGSTKFTPEIQRQMAAWIARTQGLGAWQGFRGHPSELAKARTAMAVGGSDVAALSAGLIPVKASNGSTVLMDPRNGFGQAFAGGANHAGTLAAAKAIFGADIAGGVARFTGFNDRYHAGRNSKHALGLAGDFTLKDPTRSAEAAEQLRNMFRAAGLADSMFKVIDEYKNPSGHATAGHLHYQFNSSETAAQFAASQRARELAAQTPQGLASSIPFTPPPARPGGMFDPNGGAGISGFHAPITINGANQSPEEIATAVQRRIQEAMNWRTHDVESELT